MVEIERIGPWNEIIFSPTFGGSIAATGKEPMQHGEINGSFNVKLVVASCHQRLNYFLDAAFLPQAPKDQVWPDPQHPDRLGLSGGMRIDDGQVLAMTQARAHQCLQLSARLEFIQPAQRAKDLLAHLLPLARAMDNLQILVGAGAFDSEKHCGSLPLQSKATYPAFKQY
jgi:hypothetical protein